REEEAGVLSRSGLFEYVFKKESILHEIELKKLGKSKPHSYKHCVLYYTIPQYATMIVEPKNKLEGSSKNESLDDLL
uniref:Uncharacterized protein n=1 Tax=Romanomermis culicivorax TaxID=13658 RepID=A0A915JYZ0_ROMCU